MTLVSSATTYKSEVTVTALESIKLLTQISTFFRLVPIPFTLIAKDTFTVTVVKVGCVSISEELKLTKSQVYYIKSTASDPSHRRCVLRLCALATNPSCRVVDIIIVLPSAV